MKAEVVTAIIALCIVNAVLLAGILYVAWRIWKKKF